jgi:hypothetical protein
VALEDKIALPLYVKLIFNVLWCFPHQFLSQLVRNIMRALDPHGAACRFPLKRQPKERGTLTDSAVYYEVHCDGHEKLNFKALKLGRASIDMYGHRDHGSGALLLLDTVPNARCGATVGHLYLDMVEARGG